MTALFKLKHEDFLPLFRSLSNRQGWPFLTREGDVALLGLYYWLDGLGLYGTMGGAVRNLYETPAKLKRDLQLGERWALQDMEYEKDRDFLRFADTVHDYLRALDR